MSLDNIPSPTIARGASLGMPGSLAYSGAPEVTGNLVALPPPPQNATPAIQGGRRQRVTGLVPARAGSMHPLIAREAPRVKVDPGEVSKAKATLRTAREQAQIKEASLLAHANDVNSEPHRKALLESRDANDLVAACVRRLADLEASSASRPIKVVTAIVREPAEVSDAIASGLSRYVCLHDGCRAHQWDDEAAMRRAHPTHAEMMRAGQCHVFALLCDAPLDPLDPEGERIGYVAPVGSDGTTVAAAAVKAEEEDDRDAEVTALRAELAEMREALAVVTGKGAKKAG